MSYVPRSKNQSINRFVGAYKHTSKDDHVARVRLELLAHGTEHHAPHRVVRDEEARVDVRLVVFDAARHERCEDEVAVYTER
jgi:hypothetical protein